jgi:transcriptional regulator with XRE-family HTH domain
MPKTTDPTGFGGRLRALREARGLSQAELGERAGLNQFSVAKLEQGVREPTWATALALARALGVEVQEFVAEGAGRAEAAPNRPRGRPRKAGAGQPPAAPGQAGQKKAGRHR